MRRDTVKYIALLFCLTLVIPFLSDAMIRTMYKKYSREKRGK